MGGSSAFFLLRASPTAEAISGHGSPRRCIEDGFEWAEVDVRLTKDGHHLLSHSNHAVAGPNESQAIAEHTLAELKQIDVGGLFAARYSGEHLPSLDERLELAKGKLNLYLDCKSINPERLVHDILDTGMEHQVVVYDSIPNLHRIDEFARGRLALMAKWHPDFGIEPWVRSNHLSAVEINADEITPEATHTFHDLGIKVQVKVLGEWDRPPVLG
ncbi:MAG TPA: glycerophosphodiester phosphodiesterase family protein [Verrucomicrobiae bacterium]|nr:glycerophosphodiester phosphodiesterase family protein [Verrucomicrobiae bacterium]